VTTFADPTRLGSLPFGLSTHVTEHSGSPAVGPRALRFTGASGAGGGPAGLVFGCAARDAFALPSDFHFEGLVQFDDGSVSGQVGIAGLIGASLYIYRKSSGFLAFLQGSTERVVGSTVMGTGVVHAWALTRSSGTWTLRLNGVSQGTWVDSTSLAANIVWFGSNSGANERLTGYMDEVALYGSNAGVTADYTPSYAEIPEGGANANWSSIALLIHGDEALVQSSALLPGPDSLLLYAPSWPVTPRATPDATRLDVLRNFGNRSLSGVVDYITTPAAGRIVRAYDKASGVLLRETATAGDGTYSFPDLLGNRDYYVVALDSPPNPASAWDTDISPIVQAT
jgi:Concanavalin A-like lectin/glucanases superfamily